MPRKDNNLFLPPHSGCDARVANGIGRVGGVWPGVELALHALVAALGRRAVVAGLRHTLDCRRKGCASHVCRSQTQNEAADARVTARMHHSSNEGICINMQVRRKPSSPGSWPGRVQHSVPVQEAAFNGQCI